MPPLETPILLPSIPYVSSEEGVQIPPTTPSIFTGTSNPNGLQDAPLGSLFIDISENLIYIKKTAGVSGWKRSAGQMVVPLNVSGTGINNTPNAPNFVQSGDLPRTSIFMDLTNFSQVRLVIHILTASASPNSPRIYIGYSPVFSNVSADFDNPIGAGGNFVSVSAAVAGGYVTEWTDLADAAKGEVWLSSIVNGGDDSSDWSISQLSAQFR